MDHSHKIVIPGSVPLNAVKFEFLCSCEFDFLVSIEGGDQPESDMNYDRFVCPLCDAPYYVQFPKFLYGDIEVVPLSRG